MDHRARVRPRNSGTGAVCPLRVGPSEEMVDLRQGRHHPCWSSQSRSVTGLKFPLLASDCHLRALHSAQVHQGLGPGSMAFTRPAAPGVTSPVLTWVQRFKPHKASHLPCREVAVSSRYQLPSAAVTTTTFSDSEQYAFVFLQRQIRSPKSGPLGGFSAGRTIWLPAARGCQHPLAPEPILHLQRVLFYLLPPAQPLSSSASNVPLTPSYKDPCDDIGPTWMLQDLFPAQDLNFITSATAFGHLR